MTQQQPDSETTETDQRDAPLRSEVLLETSPTIKPTAAAILLTTLLGGGVMAYLFANPETLGNTGNTEVALNIVLLLTVIGIVRLLVRIYVLTRTSYVLTSDSIRREYTLLFKTFSRDLPLSMLRSHELHRSRLETLFGIGTVGFLTGSAANTPTHVEFEHVSDPEHIRKQVQELVK